MEQELLYKYFKGTTSEEEERLILDWVDASPENRKAFQKERMLYDIALFTDEKQMNRKDRKARIIPMLRWSARIAAVVIVAISFGFLFKNYQYEKSACQQTITVPAGQRAQITLADGTKVWLNSKSTLTYASNFGRKERNVELDGEAYFEVAKNKKIPFFVNTEGIVDIYPIGSDQVITRLTKDEFFGSYNGKYKKTTLPSYEYLRWKEGLYCFDDAPFNSLLNKLEKYYNVNISVRNLNILNYRCTGKFKEQDGIEHILKVIQKDHKFTYSINEEKDSIIIE